MALRKETKQTAGGILAGVGFVGTIVSFGVILLSNISLPWGIAAVTINIIAFITGEVINARAQGRKPFSLDR